MTPTPPAPTTGCAPSMLAQLHPVADGALPDHLVRLVGPHGSYIRKQHRTRERFERERDAYRIWVPAIPEIAPRLVCADEEQLALLLTAAPGRPGSEIESGSSGEIRLHRAAGVALRRLHDLPLPASSIPRIHTDLARRLRGWTSRAGTLIDSSQRLVLARAAESIAATPLQPAACHLDYQPRNWLARPDGHVTVVDFEHARIDARIRDLARLAHRQWIARPALKDAFLDGYGHALSADEEHQLREFGALEAVTALVRGAERRDGDLAAHGRTTLARLTSGA